MSLIAIFGILALVFTTAVVGMFLYRFRWLQRMRISFPDLDGSFFDKMIAAVFGGGKIEKFLTRQGKWLLASALATAAYCRETRLAYWMEDRVQRILGKKKTIPERETSSFFLKSIAEHKRKMRAEEERKV